MDQGLNLAPALISLPHICRDGPLYFQHPREEAAPTVWLTWGSVLAVGFWSLLKLEIPLTENLVLTQVPSWTKKKNPAVWESLHGDGKEFGKAFTDTGTIPFVFF